MSSATDSRRDLWNAVIQQALADATSDRQTDNARLERSRARTWFETQSADFAEVCELAGFEPSQVRRVALDHIAAIDAGTRDKTFTRKLITHDGVTLSVSEWSKRTGLTREALRNRIRAGWTDEQIVTLPQGSRPYDERVRPQALPTERVSRTKPRERHGIDPAKRNAIEPAKRITFDGRSLTISAWAVTLGISRTALHNRLAQGWPLERALSEGHAPKGPSGELIEFNGEALTVKGWAERLGIRPNTLSARLSRSGKDIELALTMPKGRGRGARKAVQVEISHH